MTWLLISIVIGLGPEKVEGGIRFTYYDPRARQVYLAGDFNGWDVTATPMKRDDQGVFSVVVPLGPGRYEYKFVVDGQWVADPYNPVTVGPYGNSVIQVDEKGNLVPVLPTSNTPLSSMVYVHGDLRSQLKIDRDTVENRYRLFNHEEDVKLDLTAQLSGVKLWSRLRYNTRANLDTVTRLVPVRIERALLTMGSAPTIKVFYNKWIYESKEPFHLIGMEGEYWEPFGRDEQGILVEGRVRGFQRLLAMYSNEISSDRDLLFFRAVTGGTPFQVGFSFRGLDAFNRQYQVPSPDSLRVPDQDTVLLHFNLFDREGFGAVDGRVQLSPTWSMIGAWGKGVRWVVAGENDVNGQKSLWVRDHRTWKKFDVQRWYLAPVWQQDPWSFQVSIDREEIDYTPLFFRSSDRKFQYTRVAFQPTYKGERLQARLTWAQTTADVPDSFPWSYLFDYSWASRLQYYEFPLVGYQYKVTFQPEIRIKPLKTVRLWLFYRGGAAWSVAMPSVVSEGQWSRYLLGLLRPDFYAGPLSVVEKIGLDFQARGWRLYLENRWFRLFSHTLQTAARYSTFYAEISYAVTPAAVIRLSYGLRPWDLNDDERAQREFLRDHGVTNLMVQQGYLRLGRAMSAAEKALSHVNTITLWGELRF